MTYDMRGAWDEYSGHHTGLYANSKDPVKGNNLSVDDCVNYYINNGADPEKVVIGAAYYTRGWDKVSEGPDASNPGLFGKAEISSKDADNSPSRGAINEADLKDGDGGRRGGIWSYRSIDKLKSKYPNLKEYWDDEAKAPFMYDNSTKSFYTFDNKRSIKEKAKYVKEKKLGGIIGWMSSQDAPTNSSKRDELTKATKEGLFGDAKLQAHNIKYNKLDVNASIIEYKGEREDEKGFEITISNNEKLEETQDVLKSLEQGAETIKLPKLYISGSSVFSKGDYTAGSVTYENGKTVVDLSSVWDAQKIIPGSSYTFKIKGDGKINDISMSQRISKAGAEIGLQNIHSDDSEVPSKNEAPYITGIENKTIKLGDKFDKLEGVSAYDKEDGDLTSKIKVEGNVDISKLGSYELIYSVEDSQGLKFTKNRSITVVDEIQPEDTFIFDKIYNQGDTVIYKGSRYTAKYWVTKQYPDESIAWEKEELLNEDGSINYTPGKSYTSGQIVKYNGKNYRAKWWTNAVPGSDSSWELVN